MKNTLIGVFAGMLRKQGQTVTIYECLEIVEFENFAMNGMIYFDKVNKCHKVRWKMKQGFILNDLHFSAPGYVSVQFDKAYDLLNFLQRRLIWKKQSVSMPFYCNPS